MKKKYNIIEALKEEIGTSFKIVNFYTDITLSVVNNNGLKRLNIDDMGVNYYLDLNNESAEFELEKIEKEIDWSKVPRGTKVQVKDNEKGSWRNAYFSKFIKENEEYSFRASFINDDEFTNIKMDDNEWGYKYCRIHESVEIREEWYKNENEEDL